MIGLLRYGSVAFVEFSSTADTGVDEVLLCMIIMYTRARRPTRTRPGHIFESSMCTEPEPTRIMEHLLKPIFIE